MIRISEDQFLALATLTRASNASKSREAAKLVLVHGSTIAEAAQQAGASYQNAYDAVRRFHHAYELAIIATNHHA